MCAFEHGLATVHHELSVFARKDDQTVAPLGVPEDAAPQQQLVVVQRVRAALPLHRAIVLAQTVVRRLADDLSYKMLI